MEEKLGMRASIEILIVNGEVVIPVQDDVENIALWTDQDNYTIYHKPIAISPTVELVFDRSKNRWVFRSR